MNKKAFFGVLFVLALVTINFCAAHEIDNSTSEDYLSSDLDDEVLDICDNDTGLQSSEAISTRLEVKSTTEFDVIGDYFKVKLADVNGNALKNTKVSFKLSGKTYSKNTDSKGIASLQLKLNDGEYKIVTKFDGNSNYKSSSLTTTVKMTNTRIVGEGLSNSEIQKIIDNAKSNNVILFTGSSYSDINLCVSKSLSLVSNVNTVLKSSNGPVITIKGKDASLTTIKGFNIKSGGDAIVVNDADYVKIIKNDVSCNGNGIVAMGTSYLNITGNDITKNSKSGIVLADTISTYIFNNKIMNNGNDGITIAKSSKVYIHENTINSNSQDGIRLTNSANGKNYGEGPKNLYISKNDINKNGNDGISILTAGNNININSNELSANHNNGISISSVGSNVIQSNVINNNYRDGIKFTSDYLKPHSQDISYNAIYDNFGSSVEAKDTVYNEIANKLEIGDNWYTDFSGLCPKVKSNNIKFVVTQVGSNQFKASFVDSNGNIANLLPDRTLTYTTENGQTVSITVSGGVATFTVDAADGDIVKSTVDRSQRDNVYDGNRSSNTDPVNGQSPTYSYPPIPDYQIYEDIGASGENDDVSGGGNGDVSGGEKGSGHGASTHENTGNSTQSQKMDSANNPANSANELSKSYETDVSTSQTSAADSASSKSQSDSVVKQIIIDEDDFFRVTGISFIVLLIIFTIGFYYRDDIKEMNSKR